MKIYGELLMIKRDASKAHGSGTLHFTNSSFESTGASGTVLPKNPAKHPCLKGVISARCPSWAHGGLPGPGRLKHVL